MNSRAWAANNLAGNGSGTISSTSSTTINVTLPDGITYVNFTVSDGKGNAASGTFTVNRTS
jgi:hypothetical protein